MAVRIRMKKMGRRHRPFFRVCAVDARAARDGKVIEYLGHYDPMVKETDARAILNGERIDYWLSVGAQPSEKVRVLIKKYGSQGTHVAQQREALERLKTSRPTAPPPVPIPQQVEREEPEEAAAADQEEAVTAEVVQDAEASPPAESESAESKPAKSEDQTPNSDG